MLEHERAFFAGEISFEEYNRQERRVHDQLVVQGLKMLVRGFVIFLFTTIVYLVLEVGLGIRLSFRYQLGLAWVPSVVLVWGFMKIVMNKPLSNYD